MKLVINYLGKVLIAALAAALVFSAVSVFFVPAVREFALSLFVEEQNFVEDETASGGPTITCVNDTVTLSATDDEGPVDLFTGINAVSSDGESLVSQLVEDYDKDVGDRKQVFVYKILSNSSSVLVSEIDPSAAGTWKVFYLVIEGSKSAVLEVSYIVS